MYFFRNLYEIISKKNNDGFAIPQILILGIGVAVGVSGLIASSILGLTGSRINRQELLAKSASYSGISTLKSILNDNSKDRLFNYFWLVDNCSQKASDCSTTKIETPPTQYWADDIWCDGEPNCKGRQKAPFCTPNANITWADEERIIQNLFSSSNYIGNTLNGSKQEFEQAFNLISSKYTGTEFFGTNSILIEGISIPKNSTNKSGSNKVRVNIQINSETSEAGFGFLSAGENNADKKDSLFLGNLLVTPTNTAKGSIIWRTNLNNESDCINFKELAKGLNSSIPENGKGGIWIQPLGLPKQPRLRNIINKGTLICTPKNINKTNSSCKLDAGDESQKTFRINSLFVRGPGSKFEVSTSDNKKIILEIMGDIDIGNQGVFCHRNSLGECGSGKPENLTILFKQKTKNLGNKLICNRDNRNGGVRIKNNSRYVDFNYPINNELLPGHSFLIDNTGVNSNGKFGAFIYGPKTTFISAKPKSKWVQIQTTDKINSNPGLIVISRGSYGYINNSEGTTVKSTITNLILNSDQRLIPYGGHESIDNIEIIGIGQKISSLPFNSQFSTSANYVFLLFDHSTSNYHLRTFEKRKVNNFNEASLKYSYPGEFAVLNPKNSQNNINLGNNLDDASFAKQWLQAFDIEVMKLSNNNSRNFSGAAWVKNLCFDEDGEKTWNFSKDFVDKLVTWHGNQFNWGVKYYRGKSIILWDTLRDFQSN